MEGPVALTKHDSTVLYSIIGLVHAIKTKSTNLTWLLVRQETFSYRLNKEKVRIKLVLYHILEKLEYKLWQKPEAAV